jgi:hypothetical protein
MSRLADDFVIGATPAEATNACRGAIARFGWKVASEGANEIAISVPMMGTNWPSKLNVRFASAGVGGTRITLDGKTGGANQERHLGKVIAAMRAALEQPGPAARFGEATAVERPDAPEQPAAPPPQAMYGPVPGAGYQLPIAFDLPQPKPFLTARAFALIVIVAVAAVAAITMIVSAGVTNHALQHLQPQTRRAYEQVQRALETPPNPVFSSP